MILWMFIFCVAMGFLIVIHGHRQNRKARSSAPDLDGVRHSPLQEPTVAPASDQQTPEPSAPPSMYVDDIESADALHTLQTLAPRIYRMTFAGTRWAEVAVVLHDTGALYDTNIGAYHFISEGELLFSIAAEGEAGALPDPLDRQAYQEPVGALLLLLPQRENRVLHDGQRQLLEVARELVTTGGGELERKEIPA